VLCFSVVYGSSFVLITTQGRSALLSPELTSSPTVQVPIDEDGEEVVLAGQNTGPPAVNGVRWFPVITIGGGA